MDPRQAINNGDFLDVRITLWEYKNSKFPCEESNLYNFAKLAFRWQQQGITILELYKRQRKRDEITKKRFERELIDITQDLQREYSRLEEYAGMIKIDMPAVLQDLEEKLEKINPAL